MYATYHRALISQTFSVAWKSWQKVQEFVTFIKFSAAFRGVNLFPTLWGSKVTSLPSLSLPLEVGPLIQLGGLGERCKLPQWGLGRSPSRQRFWCIFRVKERCWWHSRCTVWNIKKTAFLYIFYEEVFQELISSIYSAKSLSQATISQNDCCQYYCPGIYSDPQGVIPPGFYVTLIHSFICFFNNATDNTQWTYNK